MEDKMVGRRRASIAREVQLAMGTLQSQARAIDWTKVFKASFMLLFVSYPGTVACNHNPFCPASRLPWV